MLASATAGAAPSEVPCAGEGPPLYAGDRGALPPPLAELAPTALITASLAAAGPDAVGGGGVRLERARLGVCGRSPGAWGALGFRLVWEPFSVEERAHADARAWGRLVDASIGWTPYTWLAVVGGVQRVASGRGREQPVGALALPLLPYATLALEPDRRLGGSLDADLGPLRLYAGAFAGARTLDLVGGGTAHTGGAGGLLAALRITVTPFGPLGARAWPDAGKWTERPRPRLGLTAQYQSSTGGALVGIDGAIAIGRLHVALEGLYATHWQSERVPGVVVPRALGLWGEGLVRVSELVSVVARAELLDENAGAGGPFVALSGGLNLALPGPLLSLQAMATHVLHLASHASDDVALVALTVER